MKAILFIDTSQTDTARVSVSCEGRRYEKTSTSRVYKSQMVLPLIEEVLRKQKLTFTDIAEIQVVTGPGSFTGLRVGVSVANVLGNLLDVPVNGQKALVNPEY